MPKKTTVALINETAEDNLTAYECEYAISCGIVHEAECRKCYEDRFFEEQWDDWAVMDEEDWF